MGISDVMRTNVLRATFKVADKNGNGTLDREELSAMVRKMVPSLSGADVMLLFRQADVNNDGRIVYSEFLDWLHQKAPSTISDDFRLAMASESDLVRFGFRLWDKNNDGTVSKKELYAVLRETCSSISAQQIEANGPSWIPMVLAISYEEFV